MLISESELVKKACNRVDIRVHFCFLICLENGWRGVRETVYMLVLA